MKNENALGDIISEPTGRCRSVFSASNGERACPTLSVSTSGSQIGFRTTQNLHLPNIGSNTMYQSSLRSQRYRSERAGCAFDARCRRSAIDRNESDRNLKSENLKSTPSSPEANQPAPIRTGYASKISHPLALHGSPPRQKFPESR